MTLTIATAQSHIGRDARQNGAHLRTLMHAAARAGARLVHLPEAALSGYVVEQIGGWAEVDWDVLHEELAATADLARRLGLWVVLGCNHRLAAPARAGRGTGARGGATHDGGTHDGGTHGEAPWPQNSLHVISDQGVVAGRYSKRKLSNTELTWWYTPGSDPLVFDVDGVRLGCALCIEVVFPPLFAEYERLQADCVLLSMYSADARHGLMARAHAATNCYWVSLSSPAATSAGNPSSLIGPDGEVLASCPPGQAGIAVQTIDRDDPRFVVPLRYARPWRAQAGSGEIYAGRLSQGVIASGRST